MPRKKGKLEFRYYEVPHGEPLLALLGEPWVRRYGYDEKNKRIKDLHFHNLLEIGYCYDGEGEVVLEDEPCRYGAGTVTVIPNNYPHTTNSDNSEPSRWEYLFIDLDRTAETLYPNDQRYRAEMVSRIRRRAVCTDTGHRPELGNLIRMVLREMENRQDMYKEAVYGLLRALFVEITRCADQPGERQPVRHHKPEQLQIARGLEYVGNHYDEAMKISDLAAVCHLSETHFRRLFVKCTGMHPVDYINQVRVRMACEYMKKENIPVSEIAERCGFCSLATFNRNFRKYTGASPKEWKKSPEAYESRLSTKQITVYEGW